MSDGSSWDDGGDSTFATVEDQTTAKEGPGFSWMNFVFFSKSESSDSSDADDEDESTVEERRSSRETRKKRDWRPCKRKPNNGRYKRQESDDASANSNETSETALYRYLANGLPVSGPEILSSPKSTTDISAVKPSKHGWWKGTSSKREARRLTAETQRDDPPKAALQAFPTSAVHPWTKSNSYVAPWSVFSEDTRDDGSLQRIQPWEETREYSEPNHSIRCFPPSRTKSLDDDWSFSGSVPNRRNTKGAFPSYHDGNGLDLVTTHKSKHCMLWPKQRDDRDDREEEEEDSEMTDDDADSFLQFSVAGRQPPEAGKESQNKSDLLDRMDEFEKEIQETKTRSCSIWPKVRPGENKTNNRDQPESNERAPHLLPKNDSFTDLIQERKNKRCFLSWTPSKPQQQYFADFPGDIEVSISHDREQPEEYIDRYDNRNDKRTDIETVDKAKGRHCWPKPTYYSPVLAEDSDSNSSTSRTSEVRSKRCSFPLRSRRQKPQQQTVDAASDAFGFVDQHEREPVAVYPAGAIRNWLSNGNRYNKMEFFGMQLDGMGANDEKNKNTASSVAGTTKTGRSRVSIEHLYPVNTSTRNRHFDDDTFDARSNYTDGSGWFTLDSLVA